MNSNDVLNLLQEGIQLANEGRTTQALSCFARIVQADPQNSNAWYWLWKLIDDPEKKKYCHDKVSSLDPEIFIRNTFSFDNKEDPKVGTSSSPFVDVFAPDNYYNINATVKQANTLPPQSNDEPQESISVEDSFRDQQVSQKPPPDVDSLDCQQESQKDLEHKKISIKSSGGKGILKFFFGGLLFGLLIFGIPVIYFVNSGVFDPFQQYLSVLFPTPTVNQNALATAQALTPFAFPPTFTPTPQPTLLANNTTNIDLLREKMNQAYQAYSEKDYANAILLFDEILSIDPYNAEVYFRHAKSYYFMKDHLRSSSEYSDYLQQAVYDLDQAIDLDPTQGDYFVMRGLAIWDMIGSLSLRSERSPLFAAALENIETGVQLGTSDEEAPIYIAKLLRWNGECEQSVSELEQLYAESKDESLIEALALSYICLGDYQKANEILNQSIECECGEIYHVMALFGLNRNSEALDLLNESIADQPGYGGERYFWRALIYYQQGKYDQAWEDLAVGEGNTWYRGSIYNYLYAKMYLMDGDIESAAYYMQYAEASLESIEGPVLNELITTGLKDLEVEPLNLKPVSIINITPIPKDTLPTAEYDPLRIPTQPIIYYPDGYEAAAEATLEDGIKELELRPNTTYLFHFTPKEQRTIQEYKDLTIIVQAEEETHRDLQLIFFRPASGWRYYYPSLGETTVIHPQDYVFDNYDFYIAVSNTNSSKMIYLNSLNFSATVDLADDSTIPFALERVGFLDSGE